MTLVSDWQQRLIEQLDRDQPQWCIDWADQQALQQFARSVSEFPQDFASATRSLKWSTIHRMALRVISCAIAQKIVVVPDKETTR